MLESYKNLKSYRWVFFGVLGMGMIGCDPARQIQRADEEVASVLGERVEDAAWRKAALEPLDAESSRLFAFGGVEDDEDSKGVLKDVAGRRLPKGWNMPEGEESVGWLEVLPRGDDGVVVLDLESAVDVGVRNSRDFQLRREALYVSALDVKEERFAFKPQLFFGGGADVESRGGDRGGPAEDVSATVDRQLKLGLITGGEFVANLANTFLWDLTGGAGETPSGLMNFRFVQPLLRGGWRAMALQDLAQAERSFLANIRQMYQYQQSYYVEVVAGRSLAGGPTGGSGGIGRVAGGSGGSGGAGGFLGLLQDRQQIRNLEANVARLRDSHAQLAAAFEAGRINNRLQVDQAQQALFTAQSRLLQERTRQATALDRYKMELGLPPDLEVRLEAEVLDRFELVDSGVTELQESVNLVLETVRANDEADVDFPASAEELLGLELGVEEKLESLGDELEQLVEMLPNRKEQLVRLGSRDDLQGVGLDQELFSLEKLDAGVERLLGSHEALQEGFAGLWKGFRELKEAEEVDRALFLELGTELSGLLLELSLDQAAVRLESVRMVDVELEEEDAITMAGANRMDWMNARAGLHDAWRRTGIFRNALRSSLDLVIDGDVRSAADTAADFSTRGGRVQGGFRLDTPVTRLKQRNAYKLAMIRFEQAKRGYVEFEDSVALQLRETLRTIRLEQLNFELKRAAVRVAIAQVDLARLRLNKPPQPGKGGQFGATTARDLVSALSDLLDAQNDFLNAWVGYEVLRMMLDFQLGTMQVDERNLWIDPGPIQGAEE